MVDPLEKSSLFRRSDRMGKSDLVIVIETLESRVDSSMCENERLRKKVNRLIQRLKAGHKTQVDRPSTTDHPTVAKC